MEVQDKDHGRTQFVVEIRRPLSVVGRTAERVFGQWSCAIRCEWIYSNAADALSRVAWFGIPAGELS